MRSIVRRLAGEGFEGRDNGTPASDRAQELLIRKLRRLGEGANQAASGDEAYRQPFALWDAEGDELVGSLHYVQNPLVPLARTVAYVNVDIQGAHLLPSLRRVSFAVGAPPAIAGPSSTAGSSRSRPASRCT